MIPRLGAVLVKRGILTPEGLDAALAVRDDEDALLGEILLRQGAVTEDDLSSALQEQHGVEYRSVDWRNVDPQIAQLIPESLARSRLVLPIGLHDGGAQHDRIRRDSESLLGVKTYPECCAPGHIQFLDNFFKRTALFGHIVWRCYKYT